MAEDDSIRGRALRARVPALARAAPIVAAPSFVALGCAATHPARVAAPPPAPALGDEERALRAETDEQRAAARTWCNHLQALYVRSPGGGTPWKRFGQCLAATTSAAPEVLRRTATCSQRALGRFQGDPFTPEYATPVGRCGNEAIEALAATERDVAPHAAASCGRANVCGGVDLDECRDRLGAGLGPHLERAVGAIDRTGRARLRACFRTAARSDLGSQVSSCLEPIPDDLLRLPG